MGISKGMALQAAKRVGTHSRGLEHNAQYSRSPTFAGHSLQHSFCCLGIFYFLSKLNKQQDFPTTSLL